MLFDSRHAEKMREWHQKSRLHLYVMAAAPLILYLVGIISISLDRIMAFRNDLDVVSATIKRDSTASDTGRLDLTYPCQRETHTATVTMADLARAGSIGEKEALIKFRPGWSFNVGIDSDCNLEMVSVSRPPFLVYFLYTVFMGFVTLVWAGFIYFIWKSQGVLLEQYILYIRRNRN